MRKILLLVLECMAVSGCAHTIAFHDQDESWHYSVGEEQQDAALLIVITEETLKQQESTRAFSTGVIHRWDAQPGRMLKQVADVELPQMVQHYQSATTYRESEAGKRRLTLELSVDQYDFKDFHATVEVHARAYGPGRTLIFDKRYAGTGSNEGGKMFGLGAFGMKSAIRQSSLAAYKQAFTGLRKDLRRALESPAGAPRSPGD